MKRRPSAARNTDHAVEPNGGSLWACQPQGQGARVHVSGHDRVLDMQAGHPAVTY